MEEAKLNYYNYLIQSKCEHSEREQIVAISLILSNRIELSVISLPTFFLVLLFHLKWAIEDCYRVQREYWVGWQDIYFWLSLKFKQRNI